MPTQQNKPTVYEKLDTEKLQNNHRWFLKELQNVTKAIAAIEKELAARNVPLKP